MRMYLSMDGQIPPLFYRTSSPPVASGAAAHKKGKGEKGILSESVGVGNNIYSHTRAQKEKKRMQGLAIQRTTAFVTRARAITLFFGAVVFMI